LTPKAFIPIDEAGSSAREMHARDQRIDRHNKFRFYRERKTALRRLFHSSCRPHRRAAPEMMRDQLVFGCGSPRRVTRYSVLGNSPARISRASASSAALTIPISSPS